MSVLMPCYCPSCEDKPPGALWPDVDAGTLEILSNAYGVFKQLDYEDSYLRWKELFQREGFPSKGRFARHLEQFFSRYPHFHERILDKLPPARILIQISRLRLNCAVDSQHLNVVQRDMLAYADEKRQRFCYYELDRICSPLKGTVFDGRGYEKVLKLIARNYPSVGTSIRQSTIAIGGQANRILYCLLLESRGLAEGKHYEDMGSSEHGDIMVFGPRRGTNLTVEVKSMKTRERLGKSISAMQGDIVAAGFFDSAGEFTVGQTNRLVEHRCLAVYMPPKTLAKLPPQVASATNYKQQKLYRSNEQFAADCLHYSRHGTLP